MARRQILLRIPANNFGFRPSVSGLFSDAALLLHKQVARVASGMVFKIFQRNRGAGPRVPRGVLLLCLYLQAILCAKVVQYCDDRAGIDTVDPDRLPCLLPVCHEGLQVVLEPAKSLKAIVSPRLGSCYHIGGTIDRAHS